MTIAFDKQEVGVVPLIIIELVFLHQVAILILE